MSARTETFERERYGNCLIRFFVVAAAAVQSIILFLGFKRKIDGQLVDGLEVLVSPFPHPVVLVSMNRFTQCLAYRLVYQKYDYYYNLPD
jgi:hypothetical protein